MAALALGIPVHLEVTYRNNITQEIILKGLNKFINTKNYNITEYSDKLIFDINKEFFNENFKDLALELEYLTPTIYGMVANTKEKIILRQYDDNSEYTSLYQKKQKLLNYYIELYKTKFEQKESYPIKSYMIWREKKEYENISMDIDFIELWKDNSIYRGEDETPVLRQLNTFKTTYYTSKLGKNLLYYITK